MYPIINPKFQALIPPLTPEEYRQLEANIIQQGCRDALILWRGILVDGHNRFAICAKHNIYYQTKTIDLPDEEAVEDWMDANQLGRRNLTPDQRSIMRGRRYNRTKKAKGGDYGNQHTPKLQSDTLPDTATALANQHGVSRATVIRDGKRAEAIEKLAETQPEQAQAVMDGTKRFNEVNRIQKEEKREERREKNRVKVAGATTPEQVADAGAKFATIVIDPPWDWGDEGDGDQFGRARPDYATMTNSQLLALPLQDLSDDDCHIYLWITNRSLPKGFELLERWGFRYVTALTWAKPSFGMGNYFRGQTEHVLFGVKGSQSLKRKDVGTLFSAPRGPNGHSSKPPEFYDLVESCSPGPYLEMFSRSQKTGWKAWGENA